jgi:hypothetical protein
MNVRLSISNRRRRRKYPKIAWNDMTRARESKDTRLKRIHHHHFSSFSSISIRVSVILVIGVEMKFPRGAITHRDSPQIKDNQIPAD